MTKPTKARVSEEVGDRFWSKVEFGDWLDCWLWTASRVDGYGRFRLGGRGSSPARAHVVAYELLIGPVPDGLELDHLCRVPACVNPSHLEAVTHAENCRRGRAGAHNADKTHCPRGHPYDEENTYWFGPDGKWRDCRACVRTRRSR